MIDRQARNAFPAATAPLTPEALAETIRIASPEGIVAVQGFAESVSRPWTPGNGGRAIVFGELALGAGLLSFQVPAETAPEEGEPVVIEGHLRIRVATRNSNDGRRGNWRITLVGHVIGSWKPREQRAAARPLPPRGEPIPLDAVVEQHGVESLLILATETGQQDIVRELAEARIEARPRFIRTNFDSPEAFLQTVSALPSDHRLHGLALARGGGAGLDVIGNSREIVAALIDNRLPVYSALGHATDIVLLDRYADQVFHSPTALGSAIGRSLKAAYRRAAQAREIDQQGRQLARQQSLIREIEERAQHTRQALHAKAATWRNGAISFALLAALLVWLLLR